LPDWPPPPLPVPPGSPGAPGPADADPVGAPLVLAGALVLAAASGVDGLPPHAPSRARAAPAATTARSRRTVGRYINVTPPMDSPTVCHDRGATWALSRRVARDYPSAVRRVI